MPLFRRKKTLWKIKQLAGYLNKLQSQVPPNYDVYALGLDHQGLDEIIRPNWKALHPIEQDFIFSWFLEYQNVEEKKKNLQKELEDINKKIVLSQQNAESKIDELTKKIQNLTSEIANSKNALIQKNQLIEDLTVAIQDKKLSAEELKRKLEDRIVNMKNQMIEQQKEFEAGQRKIGIQFEGKVTKLDEEKLLLNEKTNENRAKIVELVNENDDLKKINRSLRKLQEKIIKLNIIIAEIPTNLLEGGGN